MHARVTSFKVKPGTLDEVNQISTESVIPAIKQQAGFKNFFALEDASTGKAMLITIFETEADMKAGVGSGFVQQQAAKIAHLLTEAPVSEFYEVHFQG
jgi:heme-degrading monooxygenase HmoA